MTDLPAPAPEPPTCRLGDLTWTQVRRRVHDGAWLAVPVGATEQHGPQLPLSTDTDVADALAQGLAQRRPAVLVAPPVPYGSSGEHAGFPGTLSIGRDATRLLLVELLRSAATTFPRVLLIVGHGGNAAPVAEAVALLRAEGHLVAAWGPRFPGDAHAGRTETSLMLATAAQRVRVEDAEPGVTTALGELMPTLRRDGVVAVSPNGILGDPTGAGAAEGARLLADAVDALCRWVDGWLEGRVAP